MSKEINVCEVAVEGQVYIAASGGVTLTDAAGIAATQTMTDQANFTDTPAAYVPLYPAVDAFKLEKIEIGYTDTAGVDQITNIHFFRGGSSNDFLNQNYHILSTGAIAETAVTSGFAKFQWDPAETIILVDKGKLYFMTNWATIIAVGATGENFWIRVTGVKMARGTKAVQT